MDSCGGFDGTRLTGLEVNVETVVAVTASVVLHNDVDS